MAFKNSFFVRPMGDNDSRIASIILSGQGLLGLMSEVYGLKSEFRRGSIDKIGAVGYPPDWKKNRQGHSLQEYTGNCIGSSIRFQNLRCPQLVGELADDGDHAV